jgi:hypothetical protein
MKWEYKIVELAPGEWFGNASSKGDESLRGLKTLEVLNKLGNEEWELVSIHDSDLYLKRPVR